MRCGGGRRVSTAPFPNPDIRWHTRTRALDEDEDGKREEAGKEERRANKGAVELDTFMELYAAIFNGARRVYGNVSEHPEAVQSMLGKMNESLKKITTLSETSKENWGKAVYLTKGRSPFTE